MKDADYIGYIKLSGEGVQEGFIDVAVASELLGGIDKSLRFFIAQQNPEYAKIGYKLPVKIEPGSLWVYLTGLVATGSVMAITAYATKAAQKLAENDIGDKTSNDVMRTAVTAMKSTVKIAKHRGQLGKQQINGAKFKDNNQVIGIPNSKGEYLYVKKSELDVFLATPPKLYEPMVKNVSEEISLAIGAKDENNKIEEEEINKNSKPIFVSSNEPDNDGSLFPELIDGMYVELEGEVTRGNERSNTIGFEYKGHILTCEPQEGNVTEYKDELFGKALISGRVSRNYKDPIRLDQDKRPRIIFDKLVIATDSDSQAKLL